jgi:hypothetical protein
VDYGRTIELSCEILMGKYRNKKRQNLLWPALNIDVSQNAVILLDLLPYVA